MAANPHLSGHDYVCPVCRAYFRAAGPCPLCGSDVVARSEVPLSSVDELHPLLAAAPAPHRVLLVAGLLAVAASVGLAIAIWVVWDTTLSIVGIVWSTIASLAVVWSSHSSYVERRGARTVYSGDQPVVARSATRATVNPALVSSKGVSLNPASSTLVADGFVVPCVAFAFVVVFPAAGAFASGPVPALRWATVGAAWLGFGLLWLRQMRRRIEAGGFESRGVPL